MKRWAAGQRVYAFPDLLQVVQVHGLQVLQVLQEGRKEGRKSSAGGSVADDRGRGCCCTVCAGAARVISCAGRLLVGGPACAAAAGVSASDALQVLRVISCAAYDRHGLQV